MNSDTSTKEIVQNGSIIAVGLLAVAMPIGFLLGLLCLGCAATLTQSKHERKTQNTHTGSETED